MNLQFDAYPNVARTLSSIVHGAYTALSNYYTPHHQKKAGGIIPYAQPPSDEGKGQG